MTWKLYIAIALRFSSKCYNYNVISENLILLLGIQFSTTEINLQKKYSSRYPDSSSKMTINQIEQFNNTLIYF